MKKSLKKGLPGGPNEKVFSKEGYRSTSPDVNNPFNIISSGSITMKEKDGTPLKKGPLLGIDNLGNSQLMIPGANYQFPGDVVKEIPLAKKGGPFQNSNIYATNKLFVKNSLFKKRKKAKKAKSIYNPKAKYTYQPGGETDAMNAMMKARLAYANEFGNPAAQRMVVAPDQPYIYTGEEFDRDWNQPVGVPAGNIGTHYMASFGNYAVPFIQQGSNGLYFNEAPTVRDREAIKFDNEDNAQYFAEHYKEIAPDSSYREYPSIATEEQSFLRNIEGPSSYIETELTDDEIQKYVKGGYVVEDISVPSLTRMDEGGEKRKKRKSKEKNVEVIDSTEQPIIPENIEQVIEKPEVEVNPAQERVPLMMKFSNEFLENNPYDAYYEKAAYDYLKSKKGWNEALGINKSNLSENVAKRIQNNYYKDLEKYVTNKSKKTQKEYMGKFDKKGNWVPLVGKNNILNPLYKRPVGNNSLNNYGDGSIEMVYPEQFFIGPGAGMLGLAGRAAAKGIANLAKTSLVQGAKAALKHPIANIPGLTVGNAIASGFAADAVVNRIPEIPSQIAEGNYSGALENTLTGTLDIAGANMMSPLLQGIGRGSLSLGKGLAKKIAGSDYIAGFNKLNSGLNTLGLKKALLNKKLVNTAGKLPDSLIERRLWEFTNTNPKKRTITSVKQLEKELKFDLYRYNKLKKQHPDLDFNNPAIDGYLFTTKEGSKKIPDILKTINQNEKSGKSFAAYVKKDFDNKMDFVKNSGNSVLKNIVDESPQYLDEVYTHLKNPIKTDEQFVNDLTIQSNTYTRFMKNALDDSEYLNAVRGSNIDNTGFSMDVEGIRPSDYYGSYGYKIQPSIDRAMEIFQTPLAEKWGKRIPTFQGDVKMVPGMHTGLPENVENALRIRNERINRNIVKSYEGEEMTHKIPIEYRFKNLIRENLPEEFIQSKYFTVPKHQVFNSPKYGQSLEGFETIPLGKLQNPKIYTGYKDNEDYIRFFEGTGKGFKEGGIISNLTKKEIDKLIKQGYIIEEID